MVLHTPLLSFQLLFTYHQFTRGMAILKAKKLKSVKNLQKITESMKNVSVAKYYRAERELKLAKPYGELSTAFYKTVKSPDELSAKDSINSKTKLIVAITFDKSLCRAAHTQVAFQICKELRKPGNENTKVICVGNKSQAILERLFRKNIVLVVSNIGRTPTSFSDATKIADQILRQEFEQGKIIFNKFNSILYTTTEVPIYHQDTILTHTNLAHFDSVDESVIQSYLEFTLASLVYYSLKESACSEQKVFLLLNLFY